MVLCGTTISEMLFQHTLSAKWSNQRQNSWRVHWCITNYSILQKQWESEFCTARDLTQDKQTPYSICSVQMQFKEWYYEPPVMHFELWVQSTNFKVLRFVRSSHSSEDSSPNPVSNLCQHNTFNLYFTVHIFQRMFCTSWIMQTMHSLCDNKDINWGFYWNAKGQSRGNVNLRFGVKETSRFLSEEKILRCVCLKK